MGPKRKKVLLQKDQKGRFLHVILSRTTFGTIFKVTPQSIVPREMALGSGCVVQMILPGLCPPDYFKDGSEILIQGKGRNPRRLTPRECSRLMGFDLPGESRFKIPVSDAQAYRQFGNAVVVPVVREVAATHEAMDYWLNEFE